MLKLSFINATGTVAVAAIMAASALAQATAPGNPTEALHLAQNLGPDFTTVYLSMTRSERDLMLFSIADRLSMEALSSATGTEVEVTATEQGYRDFAEAYVALSRTERDHLLFKLADERSMAALGYVSLVASRTSK